MDISKLNSLITPSGTMAISNKAKELKEEGHKLKIKTKRMNGIN